VTWDICGTKARLTVRQNVSTEVSAVAIGHVVMICKTVGSAYVGSNPTPATTQNPRSRTYAQLNDWETGLNSGKPRRVTSVGAFPLVRALDAQVADRRPPTARRMRGEVSGRECLNSGPTIAKPQVKRGAQCRSLLRMERSTKPSAMCE